MGCEGKARVGEPGIYGGSQDQTREIGSASECHRVKNRRIGSGRETG